MNKNRTEGAITQTSWENREANDYSIISFYIAVSCVFDILIWEEMKRVVVMFVLHSLVLRFRHNNVMEVSTRDCCHSRCTSAEISLNCESSYE